MTKGGILQAYSRVLSVTHGVLVTWISLKCSLKASLKVRDRLPFIAHAWPSCPPRFGGEATGNQFPSKFALPLFYCAHGQMLGHHILQSISFCACSVGQDEFYSEISYQDQINQINAASPGTKQNENICIYTRWACWRAAAKGHFVFAQHFFAQVQQSQR